MALRRSCTLGLLLAVLAPGFAPLLAFTSDAEHACADHVCECAKRCPPKRSAGPDCHGRSESGAGCSMRGACRHDQAAVAPAVAPLYVTPEAVAVTRQVAVARLEVGPEVHAPVGFLRIDPRPPRRA